METEVASIIGDETYQHAAKVYIAGSGESGSELLRRRSAGCMASTYIPNAVAMKQSAILHSAGRPAAASCAAIRSRPYGQHSKSSGIFTLRRAWASC